MHIKFAPRWRLSFSTGYNQIRFSYDTYVDIEGENPFYLSEVITDYGEMNFHYLNLRLANVSFSMLDNKLILQAGSVLDILLKSNSRYYSIQYNADAGDNPTDEDIEYIFYEIIFHDGIHPVAIGAQFRAEYQIITKLNLFASGRYYFTSIYGSKDYFARASQLQFGLSYGL